MIFGERVDSRVFIGFDTFSIDFGRAPPGTCVSNTCSCARTGCSTQGERSEGYFRGWRFFRRTWRVNIANIRRTYLSLSGAMLRS